MKKRIKKIIADVMDITIAYWHCPYCRRSEDLELDFDENNTTKTITCKGCNKKYKVKIPKDTI
jgi:transcription elongation factor Elf1